MRETGRFAPDPASGLAEGTTAGAVTPARRMLEVASCRERGRSQRRADRIGEA